METKIYLVEIGNNKVYIGKTKNPNKRKNDHKKTYGNINYTVIDQVDSLHRKDWEPLETYWIQQFIAWGFNVVNTRKIGGNGPEFRNDETKQKISKGNLGKKKIGVSNKLKGRKSFHKEDTGQKISRSKQNMSLTDEWKNKISKSTKGNKNRLNTKHSFFTKQKISKALKGRQRIFLYKPILQFDIKNNFIKEYKSIKEASDQTGCYGSAITMCCQGKINTTKGFKFKYK